MDVIHSPRLRPIAKAPTVALFPGAFHPITNEHLAVAEAAAAQVDCVWFILAKQLPHKAYETVPLEGRLEILAAAVSHLPWAGIALTEGGLFLEMAREARAALAPARIHLLCGRDAAERIVAWPYPPEQSIATQLQEYSLLVAARQGTYQPAAELSNHIAALAMPPDWDHLSATLVRQQLDADQPSWQQYVPPTAINLIAQWYLAPRAYCKPKA